MVDAAGESGSGEGGAGQKEDARQLKDIGRAERERFAAVSRLAAPHNTASGKPCKVRERKRERP